MKPIIENKIIIPNHQFEFRTKHATNDEAHGIMNIIEKVLEAKKGCSTIFEQRQAVDKVWHKGLIYKLKQLVRIRYEKAIQ